MSNFRILGNAMIDFSRVRAVVPTGPNAPVKGLEVYYAEPTLFDFVPDNTPAETLASCFEKWEADDEKKEAKPA